MEESGKIEVSALSNDTLVSVAESAEKRIEAVNKIRRLALRVTNDYDWINENGKPYLQTSGAEKVARLFGISWRIEEPILQLEEGGHFEYTYKGFFTLGSTTIEAIGTRSSKDKFFNKYEYQEGKERILLPASTIDKGDVKKAAFTNCIGNGITRLLGIRNLSWDDLRTGGIDISKISSVEYKKDEMSEESKDILSKCRDMLTEMYGINYSAELEKLTAYITKDGKAIPGKKNLEGLSEKALQIAYSKIKVVYAKFLLIKKGNEKKKGDPSSNPSPEIASSQEKNPPSEKNEGATLIKENPEQNLIFSQKDKAPSDKSEGEKDISDKTLGDNMQNNLPGSPSDLEYEISAINLVKLMDASKTKDSLFAINERYKKLNWNDYSKAEQQMIITAFARNKLRLT